MNYCRLKGRVVEKFGTVGNFADAIGITRETMSKRFHNKSYWRQDEIIKAIGLLDIPASEIDSYFFDLSVREIEQDEEE